MIAAASVFPGVMVSLARLVAGKEVGVGPPVGFVYWVWLIGFLSIMLGIIGVLVRRRDSRS